MHGSAFVSRIDYGGEIIAWRVMRRQDGKLHTPAGKKRITANEKNIGPLPRKRCEGRIDLVTGAGLQDLHLQPHGASSRFYIPQVVSVVQGLAGLTSTATRAAPGTSSRSSSSRFAANSPRRPNRPPDTELGAELMSLGCIGFLNPRTLIPQSG